MPNKRKTTRELALSGAARAKPGRYAGRGDTPPVAPLGRAPRRLTEAQRDIWREIVRRSAPGTLGASDEFAIELAVRLIERSRTALMKPSELSVLVGLLSKLGMTPADRAKLSVQPEPPKETADPWAAFESGAE